MTHLGTGVLYPPQHPIIIIIMMLPAEFYKAKLVFS